LKTERPTKRRNLSTPPVHSPFLSFREQSSRSSPPLVLLLVRVFRELLPGASPLIDRKRGVTFYLLSPGAPHRAAPRVTRILFKSRINRERAETSVRMQSIDTTIHTHTHTHARTHVCVYTHHDGDRLVQKGRQRFNPARPAVTPA